LQKHAFETEKVTFFVNSGGNFTTGGPVVDTGMTGRKLMHDTFGTTSRHGGGSFSGKDATKVDRLGSLLARYIAKNIVASGLMSSCEVQLVFLIGSQRPLLIDFSGKKSVSFSKSWLHKLVSQIFNYEIEMVINLFSLQKPNYLTLTQEGAFVVRTLFST
jgi:S-adenosylmethionine synthetase